MEFMRSSRPRGRVPAGVRAAADVRFLGLDGDGGGNTRLHFRIPTLGSAYPDVFQQTTFWEEDGIREDQTAFELLGMALHDIRGRQTDSSRFDMALLRRVGGYGKWLRSGIEEIRLPDTRIPQHEAFDGVTIESAVQMAQRTPSSRRVRVAGRLDVMAASSSLLKIEISPGNAVTVIWSGTASLDAIKEFFNQDVLLEGLGVFRPSGSLLRIEGDAISPAGKEDNLFRKSPSAPPSLDYAREVRLAPNEVSGYRALFGSLPDVEDEEAFLEALEGIR